MAAKKTTKKKSKGLKRYNRFEVACRVARDPRPFKFSSSQKQWAEFSLVWGAHGGAIYIIVQAYGDLARKILNEIREGDFVHASGFIGNRKSRLKDGTPTRFPIHIARKIDILDKAPRREQPEAQAVESVDEEAKEKFL